MILQCFKCSCFSDGQRSGLVCNQDVPFFLLSFFFQSTVVELHVETSGEWQSEEARLTLYIVNSSPFVGFQHIALLIV